MKTKTLAACVAASLIGVGAYWLASPYITLHSMRSAAKELDAKRLNEYIDYDKLRANMKAQFQAKMLGKISERAGSDASAAANFGAMIGMAMVDRMLDAMVTPETVMAAMNQARLLPKKRAEAENEAAEKADDKSCTDWSLDRVGTDRAFLRIKSTCDEDTGKFALVLDRVGFASWKLTDIQMSALSE